MRATTGRGRGWRRGLSEDRGDRSPASARRRRGRSVRDRPSARDWRCRECRVRIPFRVPGTRQASHARDSGGPRPKLGRPGTCLASLHLSCQPRSMHLSNYSHQSRTPLPGRVGHRAYRSHGRSEPHFLPDCETSVVSLACATTDFVGSRSGSPHTLLGTWVSLKALPRSHEGRQNLKAHRRA